MQLDFQFFGCGGVGGVVIKIVEFLRVLLQIKQFPLGLIRLVNRAFLAQGVGIIVDQLVTASG